MKYDLLIGTHHKTGTVWMRSIFAQIAYDLGVRFERIRFADEAAPPEGGTGRTLTDLGGAGEPADGNRVVYFDDHSGFPGGLDASRFRGLHVVRDPRDLLISAANYHGWAREGWLHDPRDDFGGATYQQMIRKSADLRDAIRFEMASSSRYNIQSMVRFDCGDVFYQAKYEELITDRDLARFTEIFEFLGLEGEELEVARQACLDHSMFSGSVEAQTHSHVQSGAAQQWEYVFDHDLLRDFEASFPKAPEILGYQASDPGLLVRDDPRYHHYTSRFALNWGREDDALASAQRAVELAPTNEDYHRLVSEILARQGKLTESERILRTALQLCGPSPRLFRDLSDVLAHRELFDVAVEAVGNAIALKPTDPQLHFFKGNLRMHQQMWAEAEAAYRDAVSLNKRSAVYRRQLAEALERQARTAEAIETCREAIAANPGHAPYHTYLGTLLAEAGRLAEAEAALETALGLDPDSASAWQRISGVLDRLDRLDDAIAAAQKAAAFSDTNANYRDQLGRLLERGTRVAEAEQAYRDAIALDPQVPRYHRHLSGALEAQGRLAEAIDAAASAADLSGDNARYFAHLGRLCRQAGQPAAAAEAFGRALQCEPGNDAIARQLDAAARAAAPAQASPAAGSPEAPPADGEPDGEPSGPSGDEADLPVLEDSILTESPAYLSCLSHALADAGHLEAAIETAVRAAEMGTGQERLQRHAEQLMARREELTAACDAGLALLLSDPADGTQRRKTATDLAALGRIDEAVEVLRPAMEACPEDQDLAEAYAALVGRAGLPADAPSVRRIALRNACRSPEFHADVGGSLERRGDMAAALQMARQAVELAPGTARHLRNLGEMLLRSEGDTAAAEAEAVFRTAHGLEPDKPGHLRLLGDALARQERWAEAGQAFQHALTLAPDSAAIRIRLGDVLAASGDMEGAAEAYRRAIALKPEALPVYGRLTRVLDTLGQRQAAADMINRALALAGDDTAQRRRLEKVAATLESAAAGA
ncbi:MAG: tetratricopeptide repeat protein [Rhodospirillaceae bacterium]|nr:tetratricopeptide repeat protein [Rhodospirillaceae bacterium]